MCWCKLPIVVFSCTVGKIEHLHENLWYLKPLKRPFLEHPTRAKEKIKHIDNSKRSFSLPQPRCQKLVDNCQGRICSQEQNFDVEGSHLDFVIILIIFCRTLTKFLTYKICINREYSF